MKNQNILLSLAMCLTAGLVSGAAQAQQKTTKAPEQIKSVSEKKEYCPIQSNHLQELVNRKCWSNEDAMSFVKAGADPNVWCAAGRRTTVDGRSILEDRRPLLMRCVKNGDEESVACLLNHRANPNCAHGLPYKPYCVDGHNCKTLFYARSPGMARLLLGAGADVYIKGCDGTTALHHAAGSKEPAHLLAALCQAGVDPNIPDDTGETAFHWLFNRFRFWTSKIIKGAEVLSWYGGDVDCKDHRGYGPIKDIEEGEIEEFVCQMRHAIAQISVKKEHAVKSLAALIASRLNGPTVLTPIIIGYSGIPALPEEDIDEPVQEWIWC